MRTIHLGSMALVLTTLVQPAIGAPRLAFTWGDKPNTYRTYGIVGIEGLMDDCDERIASVTVSDVVFAGPNSNMIVGFRANHPVPGKLYSIDGQALYRALSTADQPQVQVVVAKGAKLLVTYQVCGSGGFFSVRDIFQQSSVNRP